MLQIHVEGIPHFVQRAFGWKADPSHPMDAQHNFFDTPLANVEVSGGDIDHRDFFKPISNQLKLPFCTANAGADAWEAALVKALVDQGKTLEQAHQEVPELSRTFLMWYAHSFMEPSQVDNLEAGGYNRHIMEVIARYGAPPEELWPYDSKLMPPYNKPRPCVRPSIQAQRAAVRYRSRAFYNIPSDDKKALLQGVDQALEAGHDIVWGTLVGTNFTQYTGGVINPMSDNLGGHAMVICGKIGGNYLNRNSWGLWGMQGYCLVSPEYVTWEESSSFWVPVPGAIQ